MLRRFRNLPIAVKLNLVQAAVLLVIIFAAAVWTAWHLRQQLERTALHNLQQTNRLAVSMLEAYDRSLRNDIERSGRVFAGVFDEPLELAEGGAAPRLLERGTPLNDRFDVVDAFTAKAGTVATIFVRQGDDFLRTATSLKKEDGSRASGTVLGPDHPARQSILAGNSYTGKASLFGRDYMTHYTPARDAAGKVVGIFFVGLEFSEGLKALKQNLLAIKVGETGHVYALDAGRQKGVFTVHPTREGTNVLTSKDSRGFEFVREMLDRKSGTVRYDWASPGEAQPRERMTVFDHYPGWDWVVASGSYTDEISREADSAVRNIALMSLAIIVAALVSGFVATRVWVTRPLQEVMGEADRIAAGDLTGHLTVDHADEVGRLKQAIGKMAEHLKTTIGEVRGTSGTMLEHSLALVASAEQVSQSSQVQSNAATGMAASVDEMSVSIDQVVQHAHDAQRISGASGQVASQGAEVITGIQDGARAAVAQMEEGVGRVEQGGVLANRAGQAIGEIDVSTRRGGPRAPGGHQGTNHTTRRENPPPARLDQALGRFRVG
ncbi:MAG: methyl-accepting chemotaxis protein [Candidatus Accumulibacter sp.]|uniref:Methyl-accepting chemotaxis protein n=1 Tax=Candidatus Accumulibacter proximus TaxID=2954385 RepID=A0A935PV40_9PROT|nr:methyl-accepting chemotaxis protein [Candidatus Accumulibacter proximus]